MISADRRKQNQSRAYWKTLICILLEDFEESRVQAPRVTKHGLVSMERNQGKPFL